MDVKKLISDFSIAEKIELYNCLYTDLSGKGIGGDTELAHVNPEEMAVLRAMGGAGTINPNTNLIQFIGGGGASSPPPPANSGPFFSCYVFFCICGAGCVVCICMCTHLYTPVIAQGSLK